MLSSAIFPLKLRIIWSGPFSSVLILASSTSIMTFLIWIRVIRVITRGQVWQVIFSMLTSFFLLFTFLSFTFWVWRWWRIWRIRWWRIRVWVHFRSVLFTLRCWTMFWSNNFYSSRNIINIFALLDIFHFLFVYSSHTYSSLNLFNILTLFMFSL